MSESEYANIGRVVVMAGHLEYLLSTIADIVGHGGTRWKSIMMKPGEPLRAARAVVNLIDEEVRTEYENWLARVESLLSERHALVHSLWAKNEGGSSMPEGIVGVHMRTDAVMAANSPAMKDLAARLLLETSGGWRIYFDHVFSKSRMNKQRPQE